MSRTQRFSKFTHSLFVFALLVLTAQSALGQAWEQTRESINANTVTILSGNPNGTYLYIASDISFVVDEGDEMRVLPIVGKGGAQNVRDLIYLRNIDMAIIRSDAFETYEGERIYGSLSRQLRYITRLYNEEMHILTRRDITSIDQLNGKTVNLSDVGSGTQLTSQLVFRRLGIAVNQVNMSQRDGFEALKAGQIDATILVAGKPSRSWRSLEIDTSEFHFLPVPWPASLEDFYLPTTITHEDYPNLLAKGEQVETIAAGAVLASYDWKPGSYRYERVAKFVEHFFSRIDQFDKPSRHPKWKEVNIAATIPGWKRFEPAETWLQQKRALVQASDKENKQLQAQFNAFLAANGAERTISNAERDLLFRQFMEWRNRQETGITATN